MHRANSILTMYLRFEVVKFCRAKGHVRSDFCDEFYCRQKVRKNSYDIFLSYYGRITRSDENLF